VLEKRSADFASGCVCAEPVVVGGVGGSGTRVIAKLLKHLGYFIGSDLNDADDNLWFTLLFKSSEILLVSDDEFSRRVDILTKGLVGGSAFSSVDRAMVMERAVSEGHTHCREWRESRAKTLLERAGVPAHGQPWGWKEPNTHVVLDRLPGALPGMKYILVARNGLDMAFSENQNQVRLWGPLILGEPFLPGPRFSLRYWCAAHRRALAAATAISDRFLFLNYDAMCADKERGLASVYGFLNLDGERVQENHLALVVPPASIGRHRSHDPDLFDADDIAYVESLGFMI
jgi:hypothetical protein